MLRTWFKRWHRDRLNNTPSMGLPCRSGGPPARATLGVELLEDRVTPSQLALLLPDVSGPVAGQTFAANSVTTGGDGHYSYALASGALPTGSVAQQCGSAER